MEAQGVAIAKDSRSEVRIGCGNPLAFILGPCAIESKDHALMMARKIKEICSALGVPWIYKSSFEKANRTSVKGFRGIGREAALGALQAVKDEFQVPVVTDVHSPEDVSAVLNCVDLIQIPAFLCRQTELLESAGKSGKPVMIKKGQFLHPDDMRFAAEKVVSAGGPNSPGVMLCERGSCFGYRELVVDFRSLRMMAETGWPVVYDGTHSVQVMGAAGGSSSGRREFIPDLARAAVAVGVDAIFLEVHEAPERAPSDGPNMLRIEELSGLLSDLKRIADAPLTTRGSSSTSGVPFKVESVLAAGK